MSPPIDRLIGDYLGRLSAAARGQLDAPDRRELVRRARNLLDIRTSGPDGPPTAIEVAQLISRLGDPSVVVRREKELLAAQRGSALASGRTRLLGRMLRIRPGAARGASWHWPVPPGGHADLQDRLLSGPGPGAAPAALVTVPRQSRAPDRSVSAPSGPAVSAPSGSAVSAAVQGSVIHPGPEPEAEPGADQAASPLRPYWPFSTTSGPAAAGSAGGSAAMASGSAAGASGPTAGPSRRSPLPPLSSPSRGVETAGLAAPSVPPAPATVIASRARIVLTSVWALARRQPMEAAAVILLGLGGLIFPPVWLLGAAVALGSRLWNYRDKWLGLALPVLATILGAVAGVAAGGDSGVGHNMHEGWLAANISCRLAAVLGAAYLAWRSVHGRRPPATPPWNKPHKVG